MLFLNCRVFFSNGEINDLYVYLISIWSLEFETFKEH